MNLISFNQQFSTKFLILESPFGFDTEKKHGKQDEVSDTKFNHQKLT